MCVCAHILRICEVRGQVNWRVFSNETELHERHEIHSSVIKHSILERNADINTNTHFITYTGDDGLALCPVG